MAMAKCPVCAREVATPFVLNVDAWRWLACPHCGARVERKNPRYVTAIACLFLVIPALGRLLGHRYVFLVYALLAGAVVAMLVELLRKGLQVRKALPEPEIRLKLEE
jgi:DNA-directed RNA polymerase subunit RPC12/RpoP